MEPHKTLFIFWMDRLYRTVREAERTFTNEENYHSKLLLYMFKFYLTFEHTYCLLNQVHYTALSNVDRDATTNTSELTEF